MELENGSIPPGNTTIAKASMKHRKSAPVSVNDFLLLCVLGKGTYAKVILVRRKDNQQIYALKVLKKSYIQKRNQQSKVQSEKEILVSSKF